MSEFKIRPSEIQPGPTKQDEIATALERIAAALERIERKMAEPVEYPGPSVDELAAVAAAMKNLRR